jgi:hypothetical protein
MIPLPMTVLDEQRAIDRLAAQVASVLRRMSADGSRKNLASMLCDCLRRGDLIVTIKAIEAAEQQDDWLADSVLRVTYAEMDTNHEPISDQLRAFGQRAVLRPPVKRGRGRGQYDNWARDNGICCLVIEACAAFNVHPTRSRAARRADRIPSGISLVKKALERNKVFIEEKTIQEHIWFGLHGMLVRKAAAERLGLGNFVPQ